MVRSNEGVGNELLVEHLVTQPIVDNGGPDSCQGDKCLFCSASKDDPSKLRVKLDVVDWQGSPGRLHQNGSHIEGGHLGLPGTSILAGAAHMLDWDLAHFVRFTGLPLGEAVRLCTA